MEELLDPQPANAAAAPAAPIPFRKFRRFNRRSARLSFRRPLSELMDTSSAWFTFVAPSRLNGFGVPCGYGPEGAVDFREREEMSGINFAPRKYC
jgi:hypothetical protein